MSSGKDLSIRSLLTTPKIMVEGCAEDAPMDKYTAGIELSNACRQFYVTRLKAAGKVKERLGLANGEACTEGDTETKHTCDQGPSRRAVDSAGKSADAKGSTGSGARSSIQSKMTQLKQEMVRFQINGKEFFPEN